MNGKSQLLDMAECFSGTGSPGCISTVVASSYRGDGSTEAKQRITGPICTIQSIQWICLVPLVEKGSKCGYSARQFVSSYSRAPSSTSANFLETEWRNSTERCRAKDRCKPSFFSGDLVWKLTVTAQTDVAPLNQDGKKYYAKTLRLTSDQLVSAFFDLSQSDQVLITESNYRNLFVSR
jgi:hypothetical protein